MDELKNNQQNSSRRWMILIAFVLAVLLGTYLISNDNTQTVDSEKSGSHPDAALNAGQKKLHSSVPRDVRTPAENIHPDTIEPTLTCDQLRDDMTKPHESLVFGVNPDWEWGTKPRIGVDVHFPGDYDRPSFTPWGIAATSMLGNSTQNTRVQIRKIILDIKRHGQWKRIAYSTGDSQIMGSLYTNYETNTHIPADIRQHGSNGISVKLPAEGGSFHFMTTKRYPLADDIQEIVSRVEARLIVDDDGKADDRSQARLLVASGGDIWRNPAARWDPKTVSNVDFAIGRFRFVTNEWTIFTSHTLRSSEELKDYLASENSLRPR